MQGPFTAATVSACIPCSSSETSMIARRSTGSAGTEEPLPSPVIDVTSPPAQNPRPAPVSTTARTLSSFASVAQLVAQREDVLEVEGVEPLGPVERDGDGRTGVVEVASDVDAQVEALAASTRAKICSGPSGVLVDVTPSGRSASSTALATAACAPIAPPSPMPL